MRAVILSVSVGLFGFAAPVATAADTPPPPLACSGSGPSWRLTLDGRRARLSIPPAQALSLVGRFSPSDQTKKYGWRGRAAGGKGGDVVAVVSEEACTDVLAGENPFAVSVSLPDGRFLSGCCGRTDAGAEAQPEAVAKPTPSPVPTPAPALGDWISSLVSFFPSIEACVQESPRTEAIVFAAARPDKTVQLVLRLPDDRYADCHLPPGRVPVKVTLRPEGAAPSAEEQAAILTLLPHEAPAGGCYRSQLVFDEQGRRFGWISLKTC
jgi:uncharacterized membrane protein